MKTKNNYYVALNIEPEDFSRAKDYISKVGIVFDQTFEDRRDSNLPLDLIPLISHFVPGFRWNFISEQGARNFCSSFKEKLGDFFFMKFNIFSFELRMVDLDAPIELYIGQEWDCSL